MNMVNNAREWLAGKIAPRPRLDLSGLASGFFGAAAFNAATRIGVEATNKALRELVRDLIAALDKVATQSCEKDLDIDIGINRDAVMKRASTLGVFDTKVDEDDEEKA